MNLLHTDIQGKNREEIAQSLLESERRFYSLLEYSKFCSIILDHDMVILYVNGQFLQVTGYQKEEIIGKNYVDLFISPEKKDQLRNIHTMCINGLVDFLSYFESDVTTKYGKKICIGWNNSALKDSKGNIVATCSVGEDISEKRRAQSASLRGNFTLGPNAKIEHSQISQETEGQTIICDYVVSRSLDHASKVLLGVHKDTKERAAIKVLHKNVMSAVELQRARREIDIMRQLNKLENPYIAKLLNAVESDECFFIITEYAGRGELLAHILRTQGLPEAESHKIFKQILSAIQCCHQNGIIHRDIKHSNILLDDNYNIKLIDFGLSNFVEDGVLRSTFCGTPAYAAPEMLLGTKYCGPEVDLWSLGVVLYSMLTATFPFETVSDILTGHFKPPQSISPECLDLLCRMLKVDRKDRESLDGVINHVWTQKVLGANEPALIPSGIYRPAFSTVNMPQNPNSISTPHSPMTPAQMSSSPLMSPPPSLMSPVQQQHQQTETMSPLGISQPTKRRKS